MTNDKGKQFLLRVTEEHVKKGMDHRDSCMQCPAAQAFGEVFPVLGVVRTQQYDGVTARIRIREGFDWSYINSDALDKEIHQFDETGEFTPGLYLCEVV